LLDRLTKLETLVMDNDHVEGTLGENGKATSDDITEHNNNQTGESSSATPTSFDNQRELDLTATEPEIEAENRHRVPSEQHPRRPKGLDRYIGASFWENLSDQIHELKYILNNISDDEEEGEHDPSVSAGPQSSTLPHHSKFSNPNFLFLPPATSYTKHPTLHQTYTLCEAYLSNVDPVFKILHAPSLRRYLQDGAADLDCSPGTEGLEALKLAIFYAATVSMVDSECQARLGEKRATLLAQYRAGTEIALANANLVNTVQMSTLQAFTVYLVGAFLRTFPKLYHG
jgi:hypothetical protein